ncbi:MAG: hypothetical protein HRK26_01520 [Rickettsiaceae bacterium H1]|nr:hypothetical protein [Rickettsiaceae bacterium H1]
MKALIELILFISTKIMLGLAKVKTSLNSLEFKYNDSDELALGKLPDDRADLITKSNRYKIKMHNLLLEYFQLILAISAAAAIKHNLSAKSDLLVQNFTKSIITRLICFYFSRQVFINFNRNLMDMDQCCRVFEVSNKVNCNNRNSTMVIR